MKTCKILTAAIAAAVLSGASAMAQFNYNNGDVLAAFGDGTGPSDVDVIVDLTQLYANNSLANFQSGSYNMTEDLSSVLNSVYGGVSSSIYWSVFAANNTSQSPYAAGVSQTSANTVWATLARPDPGVQTSAPHVSGGSLSQQSVVTDIAGIGNLTYPGTVFVGSAIEEINPNAGGYTYLMTSGNANGNFLGDFGNDILNYGAGSSDLYQSNPGNPNTQYQTYLGVFNLSSGGILTFDPVPEPSTWAMIGSGVLTLLALRRRK